MTDSESLREMLVWCEQNGVVLTKELLAKRFGKMQPATFKKPHRTLCEVCGKKIGYDRKGRKNCNDCFETLKTLSGRDLNREKIRIRDDRTCQDCGRVWDTSERRFDIHHLHGMCGKNSRGYDSMEDPSGLVTLCHSCHMRNHVQLSQRKHRLTKVQIARLARLQKAGVSYRGIALQLGISYASVYQRAKPKRLSTVRKSTPLDAK